MLLRSTVLLALVALCWSKDMCNTAKCSCYTVISGDWPYKIAEKLGCTYEELQAVNPTMNPSALSIGDKLSVPSAGCVPPPPPPPVQPKPPVPGPCTSVDWSKADQFPGENPLTGYAGGNRITGWDWTDDKWRVYDLAVIGFVQQWKTGQGKCGSADLWLGLGSYPTFKSGACGDWGDKLRTSDGGTCSQVMNCKTVGNQGGQGLKQWQDGGRRRALISLGGAIASATFDSEHEGEVLARVIWEMYLGGSDSRYDDVRPFGRDVILDGVDLDLENAVGSNTPTPKGWGSFVTKMRELMDADSRKDYLIAAAPINPTYAASYGQEQYGSFNFQRCGPGMGNNNVDINALNTVSPANSVYGHLDKLDYLFPQFYNTPDQNLCSGQSASGCAVPASRCFKYCFRHWAAIVRKWGQGKCRLQLGLPYGTPGSSNGFVPKTHIEDLTKELLNHVTAEERSLFAGYMGWELWADRETDYVKNLVQVSSRLQAAGLMPGKGTFVRRPHSPTARPCGGESSDQCTPDCSGKTCGSDGCGGTCGQCSGSLVCESGQCTKCQTTCDVNTCGDDGCGGSCGTCSGTDTCNNGQCVCTPQCSGKECGDNGCGGQCGECTTGSCSNSGQCPPPPPPSAAGCDPKCKCYIVVSGDYAWKIANDHGTTVAALAKANPTIQMEHLDIGDGLNLPGTCTCIPDCSGKTCGGNGCGGQCGYCGGDSTCNGGTCETSCKADCSGKQCGPNGCTGSCGTCHGTDACNDEGKCVSTGAPPPPPASYARVMWGSRCGCGRVTWTTSYNTEEKCNLALCGAAKGRAANDSQSSTSTSNTDNTLVGILVISGVAAALVVGILLVTVVIVMKRGRAREATTRGHYEQMQEMDYGDVQEETM